MIVGAIIPGPDGTALGIKEIAFDAASEPVASLLGVRQVSISTSSTSALVEQEGHSRGGIVTLKANLLGHTMHN